jgi:hypothetical protein
MGSADPLHTLDRSAITPLVRRAMYGSTVEVSDWSVHPIHSGDGEGLGVYRFVGTGEDRGQPRRWSLILKAFGAPAEGGGGRLELLEAGGYGLPVRTSR